MLTTPSPIPGIHLTYEEWLYAPWRERTPLARPEPQPFQLSGALPRLLAVRGATTKDAWSAAGLTGAASREECVFWLRAMLYLRASAEIPAAEAIEAHAATWDVASPPGQTAAVNLSLIHI